MTLAFRDIAVLGGGCYGTFYAGQLALARDRGKVEYRRVLVVDRDPRCQAGRELPVRPDRELVVQEWAEFLDRFLVPDEPPADSGRPPGPRSAPMERRFAPPPPAPAALPDDAIVPTPLMPHLMADWLMRAVRHEWPGRAVALAALPGAVGTPYESSGPDGTRYLSFADWICPVHCIEPLTCPVIRGPRTWELADTVTAYARAEGLAGSAIFLCRHQTFGVGMFFRREALAALEVVRAAGPRELGVVVGTVSRCHGAVSVLRLGAVESPGASA